MPTRPDIQLALDEKSIEDAELLAALEDRQTSKDAVATARKAFRALDDEVRNRVEKLDLGVGTAVRIGRFRISRTETPARAVTFETEAKERLTIGLVDA